MLVARNATLVLLRLPERDGRPPHRHRLALPTAHPIRVLANARVRRVDDVRRRQAAAQRLRKPKAVDCEQLREPFAQARRRRRPLPLQPGCGTSCTRRADGRSGHTAQRGRRAPRCGTARWPSSRGADVLACQSARRAALMVPISPPCTPRYRSGASTLNWGYTPASIRGEPARRTFAHFQTGGGQ